LWLKNIQILNFRNFSRLNLEFSPSINIFVGGNSQGKTNLIEAIYCLGRGISFRTFEDDRLIKWEKDSFYLGGEGERKGNFLKYELSLAKNSRKLRRVNSHKVPIKNINYWLWMVAFSIQDVKIVQGGPFYRRNFLDEITSFLYPNFSYIKFSFSKVLNQRNVLLRKLREKREYPAHQMLGWNSQFLQLGSEIVYLRLKVLRKLASSLSNIYPRLRGSTCSIRLVYNSSFLDKEDNDLSIRKIKEKFYQKIKLVKDKEIENGMSLIGPHRDDFQIIVNKINQRIFGSQGDQRTTAIALRLAEVELLREREGDIPIILLDDVPSNLDFKRIKLLLDLVKGKGQVFIATQNTGEFSKDFLEKSRIFHIREGEVD